MAVQTSEAKTGRELLQRYFANTTDSVTAFALRLGVSRQTVHSWLSGTAPTASRFTQIEAETHGAVPPRSWYASSPS